MMIRRTKRLILSAVLGSVLGACGGGTDDRASADSALSGAVEVDGSSTVYPISEAIAEEFQRSHPGTRVTVGVSGTGGGFQRFCAGETDISDASRPIKDSERALCEENGIGITELRVAWDGLSVVTNPSNDYVDCLTVDELKRIWEELVLYGPGTDSGTFDYFTETIISEEDASRPDYTASENDNVLVQEKGGTGLGLSIVRHVAQVHGGTVDLKSRPGRDRPSGS